MKTLILGSSGLLGAELLRQFPAALAPTRKELDLLHLQAVAAYIDSTRPELIINAAAMSNLEHCAAHPDQAHAMNCTLPKVLAESSSAVGASLFHFSTDYVFNGEKRTPYTEDDPTDPINEYGKSKVAGEAAVLATRGAHFVFRVSWLWGEGGKNFLSSLPQALAQAQTLQISNDQISSVNNVAEIAGTLRQLVALPHWQAQPGLYHLTQPQAMTRYEHALRMAERMGTACKASVLAAQVQPPNIPGAVRRPTYTAMSPAKVARVFGLKLASGS